MLKSYPLKNGLSPESRTTSYFVRLANPIERPYENNPTSGSKYENTKLEIGIRG